MEKFKTNPNVCAGYDWFEENNTAYIVMEYIDGINVRDFMQTNDNKLDLESTKWIARQVINALKDIHAKGYVFRDLTPDNIMITTDYDENGHNIVKLIDFGAAVNINTTVDTALDDVILKPGYAPIEQYVTGGVLGAYTDIYALGASIYRMLSGLVPYELLTETKKTVWNIW
ncbi:serine/threonine-protein kinase [Coprobacillaceae bacterium CR2/5/TPMF4]|nr:serine/threonine-protein kinase [Coprobacillaceae bacterium CR2/5/TPMF4]